MKTEALLFRAPAAKHGVKGTICIGIDICGPIMWFEKVQGGAREIFTSDDASVARTFVDVPLFDLQDEWNKANTADIVFEAGAFMQYEGMFQKKLFRNIADAVKHAEAVSDEDGYTEPLVNAWIVE